MSSESSEKNTMPNTKSGLIAKKIAWAKWFMGHESGALAQFLKYGMVGGIATVVHVGLFFLCAWRLFPALTQDDWMVQLLGVTPGEIQEGRRAINAAIATTIGFVVANAVSYVLNVMFVFKKGRHHWILEVLLFYAAAGASLFIGTALQSVLIVRYDVMTTLAFGTNTFTSLMINYTMRRFVIFKG